MFDIRKMQETVLFERIKAAVGEELAAAIVYEGGADSMDDAAWVNETMKRMEAAFDMQTLKRLRMGCQCGYGMDEKKALVRELTRSANNMEDFAGSEKAHNAGLFTADGALYLSFPFCPCPMLANVKRLDTKTWCYCTMGYSKELFEDVWGCEVEVDLLKSIKAGDDMCLMRITPLSPVW